MTPDGELPSHAELTRRVMRLEALMDARIVTVDVYNAEKAAHAVELAAMTFRLTAVEDSIRTATRLLMGAFLAIIGQVVFLAISVFGRT